MNNSLEFKSGIKSTEKLDMNNSNVQYISDLEIEDLISEGKSKEDYLISYCKLVDKALKRGLSKKNLTGYYERHHILPRCMGGEDEDSNYVLLTALEHYISHIILFRLYPENKKIAKALFSMFEYSVYSIDRKIAIEQVKSSAIIREEALQLALNIPIVCYDENYNVYRIYPSISKAKLDGFTGVAGVISGKYFTSRGYRFSKLEEFEKLFPEKLEEFNNLKELPILNLKPLERQTELLYNEVGTKVLCLLEEDGEVCKIYNSKTEAELDGFERHRISESIKKNIKVGGYYWKSLDDYSIYNQSKVNEYYNKIKNGYIPQIKAIYNKNGFKKSSIVCYDDNNNIMKIYNTIKEARQDGFVSCSVSKALNSSESNKYAEYYWVRLSNWKDKNKLEEYKNNPPSQFSRTTSFKQGIIRTDINNDIIKIYKSIGQVREDGLFHQNVFRILKQDERSGVKKIYNNSYWYRYSDYEQKYSDKLQDYLDNHKDILL